MYEANVLGTERVLKAAKAAGTPKIVYVSTVAAFGNTHGEIVDESFQHPGKEFTSYYEQTKYEAHQVAKKLIADEALPCVIVQPGGVYGPDDHSAIGTQINSFLDGKMPLIAFPDLGMNMIHVEDVAAGILLALDKRRDRRVLRARRGDHNDARPDRDRRSRLRQEGAETRHAHRHAEAADAGRPTRRQADGPAAEPA